MSTADPFAPATGTQPLWLVTLADLALLLLGAFVLIQATDPARGPALAQGLRAGFSGGAVDTPAPLALSGIRLDGFATGSAALPGAPMAAVAWARDVARDPRVQLTVTGDVDGSAGDVDPVTGSAAVLASDRARALLPHLDAVAPGRVVATTARVPNGRGITVSLGFAGEREQP